MRNSGLEEAQAEIKIAGRNINNLRYVEEKKYNFPGHLWKEKYQLCPQGFSFLFLKYYDLYFCKDACQWLQSPEIL